MWCLGSEQADMMQRITGRVQARNGSFGMQNPEGAFSLIGATGQTGGNNTVGGTWPSYFSFDNDLVARTGPENTMKNRAYIPIVKAVP